MKFTFYHNNINVADLDKSIEFYQKALGLTISETMRFIWQCRQMIWTRHWHSIRKWIVSVLKTRRWVSILSMIRMGIGWKSARRNKFNWDLIY